jgi:hypothetical protein
MTMEKEINMEQALNELHKAIVVDFAKRYADPDDQKRVVEFAEGLSFEEGRKYIKVVKTLGTQQMVWGFVMKEDDKKFNKGDILKAASWAAPARNKARGNIFENYQIAWTGPHYL